MFAGDQYWRSDYQLAFQSKLFLYFRRYDEQRKQIEAGYPKNMRNWRGVPSHIDGALTWKDGSYGWLYKLSKTRQYLF